MHLCYAGALHAQERGVDIIGRGRGRLVIILRLVAVMNEREIFGHSDRLRVGPRQPEGEAVVEDEAPVERFGVFGFTVGGLFFCAS